MTTTTPHHPTAPPTAAPLFRTHSATGTRVPYRTERYAMQNAKWLAARTADAVAVERFDVDRGEWLLVDVIGARS